MISKIYHSKWFPRFFYKKYDGVKDSGVVGYFLIEWKILFSIGLLRFSEGSRENYHSHAFNAITWWLAGRVKEQKFQGKEKDFSKSIKPKITLRDNIHRVIGYTKAWALTFRGPWRDTWFEVDKNGNKIQLTHGRKLA